MSYNEFSYIYDDVINVDYKKWVDYIEKIFNKYNSDPKLVLELACGTGNITLDLSSRGYDMIGLDKSPDMLCIASQKAQSEGKNILFINQDMTSFELYGSVDAIICMLDGINYITNPKDVSKVFNLVSNYLNQDGLFIFDLRTQNVLSSIIGNNIFFDESENVTYVCENEYDKMSKISTMNLIFFSKNQNNTYNKFNEIHYLKGYDVDEIKNMLKQSNLRFLGAFDNLSFNKPTENSERIFIISKKI